MGYKPTIGLEVHVQLNTASKLFSTAATSFGAAPNANVSPVCLGLPGALPVLNREALDKAVLAGIALEGQIHHRSKFDRKKYFYPDLPKGYQISQFFEPYCTKGRIIIGKGETQKEIGITRIHMEEDAGKLIHSEDANIPESYVDLNRAGTPLIEIVSEPEIKSADEAVDYLTRLKSILSYIEVSDCNMEEGSLRVDCNVSIAPEGVDTLGTRVEIKNVNSFKAVKASIEYEMERQADLLDSGGSVKQETRLWNATLNCTMSMRSKEEAHDYRYFPDPDLTPILLTDDEIEKIRQKLPELSEQKKKRFIEQYELPEYDAGVLTVERDVADYFEETVRLGAPAKKASNWIMVEMMAITGERNNTLKDLFSPEILAELIGEIENGAISGKIGKSVFEILINEGGKPKEIIAARGMAQISDEGQIAKIVDEVLGDNASAVEDFKAGKDRALKALQGEIMKRTKGKVNPQLANKILLEKLK